MIELAPRVCHNLIAKGFDIKIPLPINYTLGLTYRCNARCKTCKVYENADRFSEMTPEEWKKIFVNLGKNPYWVTFTGGEPFLYDDIFEVYYDLCSVCMPKIVNIPTNGQLTDRIVREVWDMSKAFYNVKLIVNVSIDHYIAEKNDEIRGVKNYLEHALETLSRLNDIKSSNLEVGIHTVVSRYNVDELPIIANRLRSLLKNKNNYITEIAENRVELNNMMLDITPDAVQYTDAIRSMFSINGNHNDIKQAARQIYYTNVIRWLNRKKARVPCMAGYTSCQITPTGDVWQCCIQASILGNLRNSNYDLKEIWNNDRAKIIRTRQKFNKCSCPMANVSYTNMLHNIPSLVKIAGKMIW